MSEFMTPVSLNNSISPLTTNKFKRLRPTSESNFSATEEIIIKPQKQIFIQKADKPPTKLNYQRRYLMKQNQEKTLQNSLKTNKEDQASKSIQSSPNISKSKPNPNQNEEQPIYLAVEDLKRVSNPEEALQKFIITSNLES